MYKRKAFKINDLPISLLDGRLSTGENEGVVQRSGHNPVLRACLIEWVSLRLRSEVVACCSPTFTLAKVRGLSMRKASGRGTGGWVSLNVEWMSRGHIGETVT